MIFRRARRTPLESKRGAPSTTRRRMGTLEDATGLRLERAEGEVRPTAAADEDRRLVDRAQTGDVRAFEALVRRYERWVFTLALRMVGDRADAEDIAQEVFLKAYRGLSGFRGGSRFSTWLYAIASHHCLNHLASRDVRARRAARVGNPAGADGETSTPAVDRVADDAPGPDAALERRDLRRMIQSALASLTEEHRIVLILRDIHGMSYDEIAENLGVELGTVRSRLHRARMELKTRLAPYLVDGSEQ
jgi:RNA polymerase sigma-70 factor (ECF subfamily)